MSAKCSFCGNKNVKRTHVQYILRRDGKILIVDDVPCDECEFCGEQYFEARVLKQIDREFERVHAGRKKAARRVLVPVESYAALHA